MTTWRQRIGLLLFGTCFAAVIAEVGLRLAGFVWQQWYFSRSGTTHAPSDVVRVLCLGESTTALGRETSYPRQLEKLLERHAGDRRWQVWNGGVPGITTDAILTRLPRLLERVDPHIVVTMLGTNDGLIDDPGVGYRRLPPFAALRVVKVMQLLAGHIRAWWGEVAALHPTSPEVEEALRLVRSGDFGTAETVLRDVPIATGASVHALLLLLFAQARYEEAEATGVAWLATHPDDRIIDEAVWNTRIGRLVALVDARRFDEAEPRLRALLAAMPPSHRQHRALALGKLAVIAEARGEHDQFATLQAESERVRGVGYSPSTIANYRAIVRLVQGHGARVVAMQYPLRSVASLQAALADVSDVVYVENETNFRAALARAPWSRWFTDSFAGDFGHTTPEGSRLLAEAAAPVIRVLVPGSMAGGAG